MENQDAGRGTSCYYFFFRIYFLSVYSEIAQASLKLTVLPSEFGDYKQAPHAQHLFLVLINRIK